MISNVYEMLSSWQLRKSLPVNGSHVDDKCYCTQVAVHGFVEHETSLWPWQPNQYKIVYHAMARNKSSSACLC